MVTCQQVCTGKAKAAGWGHAGVSIVNGIIGAFGAPPLSLGGAGELDTSEQDKLNEKIKETQDAITNALANNEAEITQAIVDELVLTKQLIDVAAQESELLLGGAIGINTELIIFYGILIVLLIINVVFKRRD
jgi:hypothetical protein